MRTISWVAIFCLQIGIFTCSMGIDVCQAADSSSHIATSQSDSSHHGALIDASCVAHAAHIFADLSPQNSSQADAHVAKIKVFTSLALPEVLHAIEHPPKHSQS
ncbi:MAG: hypothetical protein R8J85_04445 [Mariprofundales bacterium]